MTNEYDEFLILPHHVSSKHPKMSMFDRAAQFSPFAALTGYDSAINETSRLTNEKIELDESMIDVLKDKFQIIANHIKEKPEITVTYFKPDEKKSGGEYCTAVGVAKKIDEFERIIVMSDGTNIPIDVIISLEGKIFGE